ncbi:hypothetical protein PT015_17210 [Candidatus Mycobacterium wuenschmannii]|uniref:Uncharacterized protein n=1 Tax=Candidatus Mycobacterium wuenschmannii TaxID=3027808 RepID=A0ABY8VWT6_9MYCO|nr:hypothetical protein [Candidatus Mycobacterium wuenschmannii]WIM86618.1 hypothetical protein PT015_17210 [Candidatus Mycobacterium wuenschmannii]
MSNVSGPRIPPELAMQVKQKIDSLMEHATMAATQGLHAIEEMVMSGGHSGDAAMMSHTKAIEINNDLTRVITGCTHLAHSLGIAVNQFVSHDQDAKNQMSAISPL